MRINIALFFLITFYFTNIFADCDFNTSKYIKELKDSNSILSINIIIPDSKKWVENSFKVITDPSENIQSKYKKRFKAKIVINYKYGVCSYSGKIRQSGDWKDHISFIDGRLISSLDVKLNEGNIVNAVSFKLLIPITRNSEHEVLGTLLLREIGYIAPETFLVDTNVNGTQTVMLFQENAMKEMLERNLRREGPIYEGDEKMLWSFGDYETFELTYVSLSKLINDNWARKGENSLDISLNAFLSLQKAYLAFSKSSKDEGYIFINPNERTPSDFYTYASILFSMNGSHALRPHNRKFYFNALKNEFEPIYYDGDLSLNSSFKNPLTDIDLEKQFYSNIDMSIVDSLRIMLQDTNTISRLEDTFISKTNILNNKTIFNGKNFFNSSIKEIENNLSQIIYKVEKYSEENINTYENYRISMNNDFIKKIQSFGVESSSLQIVRSDDNELDFFISNNLSEDSSTININSDDLIELISKNEINDSHGVLLPSDTIYKNEKSFSKDFLDGKIILSEGIDMSVDVATKKVTITQKDSLGWVLFRNVTLKNWSVSFEGISESLSDNQSQRFNNFGITGCLNFYNSTFQDAKVEIISGGCEDSLNIINSSGNLKFVKIINGFSDAIDLDFSSINIYEVFVSGSGNDCFDVSGGEYFISNAYLQDCGDKGLSVGESSMFSAENVIIKNSVIALSSKDLSYAYVKNLETQNVETCIEAFRKKQEFGGGFAKIDFLKCDASFYKDTNSFISVGGNER